MTTLSRARRELAGMTAVARVTPSYSAALRGAIATVAPIVVGGAIGWSGGSWMGLAGFCAATADKGGAYRTRANAMAGVALSGALSVIAGSVAGLHPWTGIALMLVWATAGSLLRVFGQTAISIGTNSIVMYIIGLAAPCSFRESLGRAGAIIIGAAWAMVMSLALWPVRVYRPARAAIGSAFRHIGEYASSVARLSASGGGEASHALFLADYGRTFEAVEAAREVLAAIRRGRQSESRRGERLLVLLEKADRTFARLASLAELIERGSATVAPELLQCVTTACNTIAAVIETERNRPIPPACGDAPASSAGDGSIVAVIVAELQKAVDEAAAVALGVNDEGARGVLDLTADIRPGLAPLVAAMSWRSIVLRHALRVGVASAFAVALTEVAHLHRGYWVTFSTFIILQPYSAATLRKGFQRIGGTLLGGVIAAVAASLVHSTAGVMALIFIGAFTCFLLLPINYALYAVVMTPTFVLLAEVGAGDWHLTGVRVVNTIIGCALGFLGAQLLWPASEHAAVRDELVNVLHALGGHVAAVAAEDEQRGISARRAAHRALQNADAALQQALSEPGGAFEPAMALVVHGRRFALAVSALAVATRGRRGEIRPLLEEVERTLYAIAAAVAAGHVPTHTAQLRDAPEAMNDVTSQLDAIREAATRAAAI